MAPSEVQSQDPQAYFHCSASRVISEELKLRQLFRRGWSRDGLQWPHKQPLGPASFLGTSRALWEVHWVPFTAVHARGPQQP